ncbi:xaa-Pro aminopeptidase ApepP-like isoform X2 [Danaus plexippus]|uniref:xaa-Pro aminopeptidase ApepP-like isoform X2 n=1 Tax=Danaus plexippus TaxID=13037 RepID=UPI002AB061EB|nr:xaa-Pro aminopeptidase ApepP-like isoform X2 [Danaus plexippus]
MLGRVIILLAAQHLAIGDLISFDANTYSLYPESHIPGNINGGKLSGSQSLERVSAVRNVMAERGIDAFIVPTSDAHNSQYIAPTDARREWLSGLSGSAGTALVTADHALLWTEGRYFTQFDMQVDPRIWTLMRIGTDVTIESWLASNMRGSRVGIDPTTYTRSSWTTLENAVRNANISIVPIYDNTVDEARRRVSDPPPARPNEPLLALTVNFTGRASSEKISSLVAQTRAKGASALVLTALDDIAYVLNIRGSDIPYNPVFFSYLVVQVNSANSNVTLFWGDGKLSGDIWQHLQSEGAELDCRPYEEIFDYLASMVRLLPPGSTVWLPTGGSQAIYLALEVNSAVTTVSTTSPVVMMKYLKNDVELGGFRSAHVKDGVAVVRFLRWVHEQVDSGADVTEINVVDKLDELRSEEEYYMGPSFATIAGAGANGAVIHYKPSRDAEQTVIGRNDMLLVDSGGQYMDGTTDITRTRHMGTPTDIQKQTFTRVLKGQIMLATAVFPRGTLAKNIIGNFAGRSPTAFYTISLAPHQTSCLDVDIMSDDEIRYLNEYHARVLSTLGPILRGRDLDKDYEWLERECAPIQRSSAVLVKSSPFLLIIISRLWYIP